MSRRLIVNTSIDKTIDDNLFYLHTSSSQSKLNPNLKPKPNLKLNPNLKPNPKPNPNLKPNRATTDNLFDFHISPKVELGRESSSSTTEHKQSKNICGIDQFVNYIQSTLGEINKFYENPDPNITKKNNHYLYYLSKVGIKCMNKN